MISRCGASHLLSRIVRRGDCSFSEFQVKWLGADSDSWVPECDIDPELVATFRTQRRNHPLPSSSPSMTGAAAAAAAASSTLSSSSATKSSGSGTFSARRGKALKSASSNLPAREHVSFCSQLTPVALARPSQIIDGFLSPVVNGSTLAAVTPANGISGGGTSNIAVSSLFCSPTAVAGSPVGLNGDSGCSSQSELQSTAGSVTSTQHPSARTTSLASQKSSLSVEFPPSFAYRLSQQEPPAPALEQRTHNAMDIGDYCVGMLPSLCSVNALGLPQTGPQGPRSLLPLAPEPPAVALPLMPETLLPRHEEHSQAEGAVAVDGSARKRRRVAASRNFGESLCRLRELMGSHLRLQVE